MFVREPKPGEIFLFNAHGWWCPHCGDLIRSTGAVFDPDDDPDPPLPDECRHCGFPEVSEEWIEANT